MRARRVALGLFADRIDILVCQGGRIVASRRLPIALELQPEQWARSVKDTFKAVRQAALDLNVKHAPCVVFYRSPTQCVDCVALRLRSPAEARDAAMLSCADSLTCPIELAVCQAEVVGRDAAATQPNIHVVTAADHDHSISGIAWMVEEAGMRLLAAVPIEAATMARTARLGLRTASGPRGYLYVGEHASFFVIAGDRTVLFARPISLGVDSLLTCLTRPIRTSPDSEPVEFNLESARALLHKYGFPASDQIVHAGHSLTGRHILPLLQPVLQRYVVELRQSLRVGLPESQRQGVEVRVSGPGTAIPGFAAILAAELALPIAADQRSAKQGVQGADSPGVELTDAWETWLAGHAPELLPLSMARRAQSRRSRRWLWSGAAAALALIGTDFMRYETLLLDARRQVSLYSSQSVDLQKLQTQGERMLAAVSAMSKLESSIATETGATLNIRACLQELARLTPGDIRIAMVTFQPADGRLQLQLRGAVVPSGGGSGKSQLETFIQQLSASPLFEKVALTNVQMGVAGAPNHQFEARLTGVATPAPGQDQAIPFADDRQGEPRALSATAAEAHR